MNNIDFSVPRRQSRKGVVLYFLLAAQKLVRSLWPLLLYYVIKNESLSGIFKQYALVGLAVVVAILLVHAVFTYLRFYFYVENGEFKVSKGYLKKVSLSIPVDRIQTINSKQNVFQQWLNVVSLEIDTAGASTKELKIVALERDVAQVLSDQLNALRSEEVVEEENYEEPEKEKLILKLGFGDLLKVGISENHLKSTLIVFAFVWGLIDQVNDFFEESFDAASEQAQSFLVTSGPVVVVALAIFVLLVGLVFSLANVFLRYFDLRFSRQGNKFQIQSGLLNKKSVSIPYSKIQVLTWRTNPIRKMMDFVTLNFSQATSSEDNRKQNVNIPGCSTDHLQSVQEEIFDGNIEDELWAQHPSHIRYAIKYWFFFGILPPVVALSIGWEYSEVIIASVAWLVVSLGLSWLAYRKRFVRISADLIETSSGMVGQKFSRMFNFKVQTIKYRQSWFQRRRNLATLMIFTAGGKVLSIPYIDSELALELYNYLLYSAESSHQKWM